MSTGWLIAGIPQRTDIISPSLSLSLPLSTPACRRYWRLCALIHPAAPLFSLCPPLPPSLPPFTVHPPPPFSLRSVPSLPPSLPAPRSLFPSSRFYTTLLRCCWQPAFALAVTVAAEAGTAAPQSAGAAAAAVVVVAAVDAAAAAACPLLLQSIYLEREAAFRGARARLPLPTVTVRSLFSANGRAPSWNSRRPLARPRTRWRLRASRCGARNGQLTICAADGGGGDGDG